MSASRQHHRKHDLSALVGRGSTFVVVIAVLFGLLAAGLWVARSTEAPAPTASASPVVASTPAPAPASSSGDPIPLFDPLPEIPFRLALPAGRDARVPEVASGVIEKGGSLASALGAHGVSPSAVHAIAEHMRPVFDFRRARPGDRFRLVHAQGRDVLEFEYATADRSLYHLSREGDGFVALRVEPERVTRTARIAGIVTSSLYDAIKELGESPALAGQFADILAWDVDFSRHVQPGDEFAALYERIYQIDELGGERYEGPGRILAARYAGQTGEHRVLWFEDPETGRGSYYRDDGSAVTRAFLAAPLRYSRISSRYSSSRRHPILKVTRPHHGIDYAAPRGTPIFAVADGEVIFRGRAGGFGNLVKIRHPNGYVSYYAHMSRFASGLRLGQSVLQKQVIGYVGSTGLATGPHVCFRVAKDGRFVNPTKLKVPAGKPVPDALWPRFLEVRDALLAELENRTLVATEEAAS